MDSAKRFQLIPDSETKKIKGAIENVEPEESENEGSLFKDKTELSSVNKTLIDKLQRQVESHSEWFKEDLKCQSLGLFFHHSFHYPSKNDDPAKQNPLEINQIAVKSISNRFSFKVLNPEWKNLELEKSTPLGYPMKQLILRLSKQLTLRSHSCKLQLEVKLQGISSFSLIFRSLDSFANPEAFIVQFKKEGFLEATRIYVLLGKQEKNEFVFVKKCEIPILANPQKLLAEDLLTIAAEILDFGNDKIYIFTHLGDKLAKPFKLKYENLLVPMFEKFQLYALGNGDDTHLANVMVEIFDRNDFFLEKESRNVCNKCKNCVIF